MAAWVGVGVAIGVPVGVGVGVVVTATLAADGDKCSRRALVVVLGCDPAALRSIVDSRTSSSVPAALSALAARDMK